MSEKTYKAIIKQYGKHFRMTKLYDNGIIMLKFEDSSKIMWFKQLMLEKFGYMVKDCTVGRTYWFEPLD